MHADMQGDALMSPTPVGHSG